MAFFSGLRVFALQTPLGLFTHRLYSGKRGDCFDGNGWIWNSGVPDLCRAGRRVYMDDYGVGGGGSVFDAAVFCRGYGSNARVWGRRYAGLVLLVVAGAGNRTGGGAAPARMVYGDAGLSIRRRCDLFG